MLTFSGIIYNKGKRSKDSEVAEVTGAKDLTSGEEVRHPEVVVAEGPVGGGSNMFACSSSSNMLTAGARPRSRADCLPNDRHLPPQ